MAVTQDLSQPVSVFISYSRKDQEHCEELRTHLRILELLGRIQIWYDGDLKPGDEWEAEIYAKFCSSQIILLLISANFFASKYCSEREWPEAMSRHRAKKTIIVPVLVRSCMFAEAPPGQFMVLPKNSKSVDKWDNRDEAYESITKSLSEFLDKTFGELVKRDVWEESANAEAAANVATLQRNGEPTNAPAPSPVSDQKPLAPPPLAPPLVAIPLLAPPLVATPTQDPPLVSDEEFAQTLKASITKATPDVLVCFVDQYRRQKIAELRKWCLNPNDPLFDGLAAHVVEAPSPGDAINWARKRPESSVLILDGFEPTGQQLDEFLLPGETELPCNLIFNEPEMQDFALVEASASMLRPVRAVTSDETLLSSLRKALLKIRADQCATVRVMRTPEDLQAFFSMRYQVWTELGYLAPNKACPETPWELDYTDRTSIPLGLFSKADGRLLGAARLVRGFGEEDARQIETISHMLRNRGTNILMRNFENPDALSHPFDILGELDRFSEYYRDLVVHQISKAEVSRVVVSPACRKLGLGEVMVDSLCSLAIDHSIQVLFLACKTQHADFYQRSGFHTIPGVAGKQFLTYAVECLAMERKLESEGVVVRG